MKKLTLPFFYAFCSLFLLSFASSTVYSAVAIRFKKENYPLVKRAEFEEAQYRLRVHGSAAAMAYLFKVINDVRIDLNAWLKKHDALIASHNALKAKYNDVRSDLNAWLKKHDALKAKYNALMASKQ